MKSGNTIQLCAAQQDCDFGAPELERGIHLRNVSYIIEVIYQTRETVFHRDIQTLRRELKMRRAAEYF